MINQLTVRSHSGQILLTRQYGSVPEISSSYAASTRDEEVQIETREALERFYLELLAVTQRDDTPRPEKKETGITYHHAASGLRLDIDTSLEPDETFNTAATELLELIATLVHPRQAPSSDKDLSQDRMLTSVIIDLAVQPNGQVFLTHPDFIRALLPSELASKDSHTLLDSLMKSNEVLSLSPALGRGSGRGPGGGGLLNSGSGPWWRRNVTTPMTSSELLIDVVETLKCVLNSDGQLASSSVTGAVKVIARMEGVPECWVALENTDQLRESVYLHPSALKKYATFEADTVPNELSFVPPDDVEFDLMKFAGKMESCRPPIAFKLNTKWSPEAGCLELRLADAKCIGFTNRLGGSLGWSLDNVIFTLDMPKDIKSVSVSASTGVCVYLDDQLVWMLGSLSSNGRVSGYAKAEFQMPPAVQHRGFIGVLQFTAARHSLTGLKVVSAKRKDQVSSQPVKGCRHRLYTHAICRFLSDII